MEGTTKQGDLFLLLKIFLAVPIITFGLVVGAEMIPDERIADALIDAGNAGPMKGENQEATVLGLLPDRWTECTALTMGLGDDDLSQPVSSALHSRTQYECSLAAEHLQHYADTGELNAYLEYYRYWWANTSLLRPSVLLFGMNGSRIVFQAALGASFLALLWAWKKRIGALASIAFLGPIVVSTDFITLYDALPQAISLSATLLVSIGVLHWAERSKRWTQFFVVGGAAGAVLNPFDLMISIPVAATLCIATVMLVQHQRRSTLKPLLMSGVAAGAGWGFGYGWVWFTKWVAIATIVGPTAVIENIRGIVSFRINGETEVADGGFLAASSSNIGYWVENEFAIAGLGFEAVVIAVALLLMIRRLPTSRSIEAASIKRLSALAAAGLLPFVWYEFASNHSLIHDWFMFRAVALALGLTSVSFVLATQSAQEPGQPMVAVEQPRKELVST